MGRVVQLYSYFSCVGSFMHRLPVSKECLIAVDSNTVTYYHENSSSLPIVKGFSWNNHNNVQFILGFQYICQYSWSHCLLLAVFYTLSYTTKFISRWVLLVIVQRLTLLKENLKKKKKFIIFITEFLLNHKVQRKYQCIYI